MTAALANGDFCGFYADVCAQLEAIGKLVEITNADGQFYSMLQVNKVAGLFPVMRSGIRSVLYLTTTIGYRELCSDEPREKQADADELKKKQGLIAWREILNYKKIKVRNIQCANDKVRVQFHRSYWAAGGRGPTSTRPPLRSKVLETELQQEHYSGDYDGEPVCPTKWSAAASCQRELEGDSRLIKQDEARVDRVRQRQEGDFRFLGALFRAGMAEASVLPRCVEMLLDIRKNLECDFELSYPLGKPDETNIAALCELLESAGKRLESHDKGSRVV
ncbi:hypothetical protein PHYSODRAFT_341219 [Phytophthora sojae]|uniref:MIF4G domain-containing protein n=1 Tax=Phytophthora sojae (strain P6497) TaxID=1094619 RepID=G5ACI6_PHYSP|nr:hypothetical protein PHYSODRAFT_341219 [Phytophthora sojae]EGZ07060.1 hypothetical protein PHYSODRAFT_341219 [Phytophthora sojae]|eukprot:XP_009537824.1 hypothetical protein PHYSODRAFT_341219 [Phytophthora sojae]